ncbi:MAG: methyltransferase domain-containing protein [Pseudonocardiales bacterium]|nr:methyltransferase domain-containing protein [Pseudonocardiales bacterium]
MSAHSPGAAHEHVRRHRWLLPPYRPSIPDTVAEILDQAVAPKPPRRLLDVGTGTGLVVEALLGRFNGIIAIDNDSDMLAAAEVALRPVLPNGTTLVLAETTAEDFTPPTGWCADLVTICRAFHWLDQVTVLQHLDDQVAPDGAVAIFSDNSFWAAGSPWKTAVRSVIQNFLGERRRAGHSTFNHHDRPYSEIMEESPFSVVEEFRVPVQRVWTTESILGYLYSTSFAAPYLFGECLGQFERQVTTALAEFSNNDTFDEDNEFLIRIGRRSRT